MLKPSWIEENVPLAPMTTFGIGGPARWFAAPADMGQLRESLAFAGDAGLPVLVFGGGSNLLVADAGVRAVVIRLADGVFSRIERVDGDELTWRVGAAAPLPQLVAATIDAGVAGLETMAGIPGRVGGAVAMNAGGVECGIGEYVSEADICDADGAVRSLSGMELGFAYRRSDIQGRLAVSFVMNFSVMGDPESLRDRFRELRERKRATQPLGGSSAGCVFKNPQGDSAGALLDLAGCKGMREGGAEVSTLHANFILNLGGAESGDVARLACRMRNMVWEKHGVDLRPELVLWGDDPAFGGYGIDLENPFTDTKGRS